MKNGNQPVQKNPFTLGRDYARISIYVTKDQRAALIKMIGSGRSRVSISEIVRRGLELYFAEQGVEFPKGHIEARPTRKSYRYKENI